MIEIILAVALCQAHPQTHSMVISRPAIVVMGMPIAAKPGVPGRRVGGGSR